VSLWELVVRDTDALECLDQQVDDIGDDLFVVSFRQPVVVQFPPVPVVFQARPEVVDDGCEIVEQLS
jgi:hypothetical protein